VLAGILAGIDAARDARNRHGEIHRLARDGYGAGRRGETRADGGAGEAELN